MRKLLLLGTIIGGIILLVACSGVNSEKDLPQANEETGISESINNGTEEGNGIEERDDNKQNEDSDMKTKEAKYMGQIDSNSIEVQLLGDLPEEEAFRAYRLSENVKEEFSSYSLKEGEYITFEYKEDDNGIGVIYNIQKRGE